MKKYTTNIQSLHEEAKEFSTKSLEPTAESLLEHMKTALTHSADPESQAKLCAQVATDFTKLVSKKS